MSNLLGKNKGCVSTLGPGSLAHMHSHVPGSSCPRLSDSTRALSAAVITDGVCGPGTGHVGHGIKVRGGGLVQLALCWKLAC